jgi:thiol:disulfide interchange protein DsbD
MVCVAMAFAASAATREAAARESAAVRTDHVTASLISDTDAIAAGVPFQLGLRLQVAAGWHTYWRNPGDAGAPIELALDLPADAKAGAIAWPAPRRLSESGITTFGYTGEVVLPIEVTSAAADGIAIAAKANWLVCEKICVPEDATLRLSLPPGTPAASPQGPLFAAAAERLPRTAPFSATIAGDGTLTVSGSGISPDRVADAWFAPIAEGALAEAMNGPAEIGTDSLRLKLKPGEQFAPASGLAGVLVVTDRGGQVAAFTIDAKPGDPKPADAKTGAADAVTQPGANAVADASAWGLQIVALAFVAGLLLNLMPCVFPVLAMKASGLVKLNGAHHEAVRREAALYGGGVMAAFATLGGVLLALRAAGDAAGWGFQFQSPTFVTLMAWVFFAVGLNLSGVFEVPVGRLAGLGSGLAGRAGATGSFFTGALAVLVATPCTTPFMGGAVAAALAGPLWQAGAILGAMGLGLAAPTLAFAIAPVLVGLMPRPGRWMELMRQGLAFPMYASCAWLVWVLSVQVGPTGVLGGVAGLVLIGFAAWIFRCVQAGDHPRSRHLGAAAAGLAVIACLMLLPIVSSAGPDDAHATRAWEEGSEPYSADRLAALRAEGRPVFVNMTAAWCVTCLVNERIAIGTEAVRHAFAEHGVAVLTGDWTRRDPEISAFLREHGRDGVPLYVFYPAGGGGVVLPQILSASTLLHYADGGA